MSNLTGFKKGENVQFSVICRDRDHAPLNLAGTVVKIVVSDAKVLETPIAEFTSPSTQVTIADAANGVVNIDMDDADLAALVENGDYYYSIWTDDASTVMHQMTGLLKLKPAVQPA